MMNAALKTTSVLALCAAMVTPPAVAQNAETEADPPVCALTDLELSDLELAELDETDPGLFPCTLEDGTVVESAEDFATMRSEGLLDGLIGDPGADEAAPQAEEAAPAEGDMPASDEAAPEAGAETPPAADAEGAEEAAPAEDTTPPAAEGEDAQEAAPANDATPPAADAPADDTEAQEAPQPDESALDIDGAVEGELPQIEAPEVDADGADLPEPEIEAVEPDADTAADSAAEAAEAATDTAEEAADAAADTADAVADDAADSAGDAADAAADTAEEAADTAEEAADAAADTAEDAADSAADTAEDVVEGVTDMADEAADSAADVAGDIADTAGDVVDAITDETAAEPVTPPAAAAQAEVEAEASGDEAMLDEDAEGVTTETVTEESARSSAESYDTAPDAAGGEQAEAGLSDFEKALLTGLGAIAVGTVLANGAEILANTGDRVVLEAPDGTLRVLKNDDEILRRPGSNVRTRTFDDGSTRTVVTREDGVRIITIRAADGTALKRVRVLPNGDRYVLFDDTQQAEPVTEMPSDRPALDDIEATDTEALRAALIASMNENVGRNYSLGQVRAYAPVRDLAPQIEVRAITFPTGSAAIQPAQAERLADLGLAVSDVIAEVPDAVFLIEGHTDAVGSAAYNLALSDRRAESVALALAEYFDVPPENLVTQGYGESELKVPTLEAERANRRVAVRNITPLLR